MIKNLKMEQEMIVAKREMLQLNPWSITLEGIILIAHKLMAALNYRCFSNIWYIFAAESRWLSLLVVRKPRSRSLFFLVDYLTSLCLRVLFIKSIL